MFARKTS
jgi:hypothetical protein